MNKLQGNIKEIETSGSFSVVSVAIGDLLLRTIVIETPETASYLKPGNQVEVLFKETEVVIGVGSSPAVSLRNRIKGQIVDLERGKLISRLLIQTDVGKISSVISTESVDELNLAAGSEVLVMIKLNEIMLAP